MTIAGASERGLGVLVVIAVTAVLAAIAAATSLAASAAAGAATHRSHELQANALASGVLDELEQVLANGELPVPAVGHVRRTVNGEPDLPAIEVPRPGPWWPAPTADFEPGSATQGVVVEIERVVGPDGAARGLTGVVDPRILLRARVEAWFRSARVIRDGIFVLDPENPRRLR